VAVETSNTLIVKDRNQWSSLYLRSIKNRNPAESIEPNSPAWIRAMAIADVLVPMGYNAQQNAAGALLKNQNESQLVATGEILHIDWPAAVGASGTIIAETGTLGSTIYAGDEIKNQTTNIRYKVTTTGAPYHNGDPIPIIGIDTGPLTNCDSATVLTWSAPRPGCMSTALVQAQTDLSGLTGGADRASADEYRTLLAYALANESASGNEATVIKLAEKTKAHGVAVQKAFVYPAVNGPGTMGLCFTIKPNTISASRIPNSTQMAAVLAYVIQWLPGDDSIFMIPLVAEVPGFTWKIKWTEADTGWTDSVPWPRYATSDRHIITASTDSSHFSVGLYSAVYTSAIQPVAGNSIAVFDNSTGKMRRKKILSFTGTGPWAITCATLANQSDTEYKPIAGDYVSPWADSIQAAADCVIAHVGTMGPGEQVAADPGDGRRQLRMPPPIPDSYPIQASSLVVAKMLAVPGVADAQEVLALSQTVTVGALTTLSFLFETPRIGIYAL
jgi:hypothetical protein